MELNLVDDAYETKMAAFESDCNDGKGDPLPCHQTAEFFSVVKEDRERAAKLYERNCREKGYPASCFNLGKLHLAGKGVKQDDHAAERLFTKACKGGHLSACYHQGLLTFLSEQSKQPKLTTSSPSLSTESKSTPPVKIKLTWKQQEALKLLEKNCQAGEFESCYFTGSHYLNPDVMDRNPQRAISLLERSCDGNHASSCFNLAVLYKKGDVGVPSDTDKFAHYKKKTKELVKVYGSLGGQKMA